MENKIFIPDDIIKIFEENNLFSISRTPVGKCIRMPSIDAFIFNDITGSGYLDNPVFPYTTKGLFKIYYSAMSYNRVSGIFENNKLCYTPRILFDKRPFLFDSDYKYILPVSFTSEIELQKKLEFIFDAVDNPTDYIIMRIESSKNGGGLESFMEYIACLIFKNNGYIVENQIPLSHSAGSPDFEAVKLKRIQSQLAKVINNGFYVLELSLKWLNKSSSLQSSLCNQEIINILHDEILVGEAKTSTTIMKPQIDKYLETGLFNGAFELHPTKNTPSSSSFGIVHFLDNFKIDIRSAIDKTDYSNNRQELYKKWIENYYKTYLFINLNESSIVDLMTEKGLQYGRDDISSFINSLSYEEIIERI